MAILDPRPSSLTDPPRHSFMARLVITKIRHKKAPHKSVHIPPVLLPQSTGTSKSCWLPPTVNDDTGQGFASLNEPAEAPISSSGGLGLTQSRLLHTGLAAFTTRVESAPLAIQSTMIHWGSLPAGTQGSCRPTLCLHLLWELVSTMVLSGSLDVASHTSSRQRGQLRTDCESAAPPHRSHYLSRPKWGGSMARQSTLLHTGSLDTSSQETRRSRTDCVSAAPSHRSRCLSFRRQPVPVSSDTLLRIHRLCCLHTAYHLSRRQPCLICLALHPLYKIPFPFFGFALSIP